MTFGHFSFIFIPPKLDMNKLAESISLWRLLVHSELLHVLLWCYRGPQSGPESENWSKLTYIMNFGHFSYFFIPPNLDMNAFSGSISFWSLLVHSEHLHIIYFFSILGGHRVRQGSKSWSKLIDIMYDFLALCIHFHII